MKILLNIIWFLIVLSVIAICIINADITLHLSLLKAGIYGINFFVFSVLVFLCGFLSGIICLGQFYIVQKEKLSAYKRELEKSSITNNSSVSKVEVLEAKIATLEKALDDALNK